MQTYGFKLLTNGAEKNKRTQGEMEETGFFFLNMQMPFARDIFYFGQGDPHYHSYYVRHRTVYLF